MVVNQHTLVAYNNCFLFLNYNIFGDIMITSQISKNTTGQMIKNMRLRAGLTQQQLGELVGLSDMTISRYEKGKVTPKLNTVLKLSEACGFEIQFAYKHRVLSMKEMLREY